jgi:photosystem II stability/assembly factor-like uncharacterized protein
MFRSRRFQRITWFLSKGLALSLVVFLFLAGSGAVTRAPASAATAASADQTWQSLPVFGGEVTSILVDPNDANVVYAGTVGGGVFKSVDAGATWQPARAGLTPLPIRSLAAVAAQPGTIYAGADFDGIWKTTNGGTSWTHASTGIPQGMNAYLLVSDPSSPNVLYAGMSGANGQIYKTTNAGASWQVKDSGILRQPYSTNIDDVYALAIDPDNPSTLYAATASTGAYRTINGGEGWSAISSGLPISVGTYYGPLSALAVIPGEAGHVGGIYERSYWEFDGSTWQKVEDGDYGTGSGTGINRMFYYPGNSSIIYTAGADFNISTDGGVTWEQRLGWPTSGAISAIAFPASSPNTIYAASDTLFSYDGGVWKTTNQGQEWTQSMHGLTALSMISTAADPVNPLKFYAGADSFYRTLDGGVTWQRGNILGGNQPDYDFLHVLDIAVDPDDPQMIYVAGTFKVFYSSDGGANFHEYDITFPGSVAAPTGQPGVAYASSNFPGYGIYKTINSGVSWTQINTGVPKDITDSLCAIPELVIDPNDPNTLWAGTTWRGGVIKTTNGGDQWVVKGLVDEYKVTAIAVKPGDGQTVLVGAGDSEDWKIFKTSDGGAHWKVVMQTQVETTGIVFDPRNADWVYAVNAGFGVFRSSDTGERWLSFNDGLFKASVSAAAFTAGSDPHMLAASNGAGLYWIGPDISEPLFKPLYLPVVRK